MPETETLRCPIDKFIDHYGPDPSITRQDILKCKEYLVKSAVLEQSFFEEYQWRNLDFDAILDSEEPQRIVFKGLMRIITKIFAYGQVQIVTSADDYQSHGSGRVRTLYERRDLEMNPSRSLSFSILPAECKTLDAKTIVSLDEVEDFRRFLCNDVRVMHIFAITIEDDEMSVSYFSHSHCIETYWFEWAETDGINAFIRVMLSFARASSEQLGFDPTIRLAAGCKPRSNARTQQYIYQFPRDDPGMVNPARRSTRLKDPELRYFKTVDTIHNVRRCNVAGRNSVIWKVVEVKGPYTNEPVTGEEFVLKDVWVDPDWPNEAENMKGIFKAIEELIEQSRRAWGDDWKRRLFESDKRFAEFDDITKLELGDLLTDENYKSLFITILHAWQGETSKEVLPESSLHGPYGVKPFPEADAAEPLTDSAYQQIYLSESPAHVRQTYAPLRQSRFLYKEVCSELEAVGTLGNLIEVVNQALQALRILFCVGWVHRDISLNTLLPCNDHGKWKMKVSNLAMSRPFMKDGYQKDFRMGTPCFMPFEIASQGHLASFTITNSTTSMKMTVAFQLHLQDGTPEFNSMRNFRWMIMRNLTSFPPDADLNAIPDSKTFVRHNFQHDLESVWWILLYFLTVRIDHAPSQDVSNKIFKPDLSPANCKDIRFILWTLTAERLYLHPNIQDPFVRFLEALRSDMWDEFCLREIFGQLSLPHTYSRIHETFAKQFRELQDADGWMQMAILSASALKAEVYF